MHYFKFLLSLYAVARIALVKPEKARGVEDVILRAAQMGQITEKVCWILFSAESLLSPLVGHILNLNLMYFIV